LVSAAFTLFKANWQQLVLLGLAYVAIVFVIGLLMGVLFAAIASSTVAAVILGILTVGLVVAASCALSGAVTRLVATDVVRQPITVSESLRWGMAHIGPILVISLLVLAVFMTIGIALFLVMWAIVGSADSLNDLGGALLILLLGYLVMAFFGLALSMAVPSFVIEGATGMDAIRRSWSLVLSHFWHALGTLALTYLVLFGISILIGIIGSASDVLQTILSFLAQVLFVPFLSLVIVLLYVNLRVKSGGTTQETLRNELAANA
jgi:hypothetical protein